VADAPLTGIRVLDFSRVLAGPHAGRMLCDLGADVIKVEPPAGDITRFTNPRHRGMASYFVQQNVGKRNISLDLDRPEARQLLQQLVAHVDVVLENFRPGVMDRLGLGFDALSAINPRLVFASINGYGSTGPWRRRRAYAPVVGAEMGLTKAQGDARGGHYANDPHSHADLYTSLEAASAILAALFQRERTGVGQHVEVTMAETVLYTNEHLHDALYERAVPPGVIRSFQPGDYVVASLADGSTIIVSGHPAENGTFERFVAAMDRRDLVADARFTTVSGRLAHLDELVGEVIAFAATVPDVHTFEERFAEHGLAVGQLRSSAEAADTEWARERGAIVDIDDRDGGRVRVPNVPWRFSAAPDVAVRGVPRYRGEDNRTVLGELLGLDAAELDRLEADGVLSSRLPS
jgi:crotonobetainyl-CoA:carnitine CoA-transferase CaiB-like acyl-CoA transferase